MSDAVLEKRWIINNLITGKEDCTEEAPLCDMAEMTMISLTLLLELLIEHMFVNTNLGRGKSAEIFLLVHQKFCCVLIHKNGLMSQKARGKVRKNHRKVLPPYLPSRSLLIC